MVVGDAGVVAVVDAMWGGIVGELGNVAVRESQLWQTMPSWRDFPDPRHASDRSGLYVHVRVMAVMSSVVLSVLWKDAQETPPVVVDGLLAADQPRHDSAGGLMPARHRRVSFS